MLTHGSSAQTQLGAEQHEPNQWHQKQRDVDGHAVGKQRLADNWDVAEQRNFDDVKGAREVRVFTVASEPLRVQEVCDTDHQNVDQNTDDDLVDQVFDCKRGQAHRQ